MAMVQVSGHGPGIPEQDLESIFRPFYKVDPARSPQTGGFGVGLAIAERSVKLHKGDLRAANRANGGLTIEMRFPTG
jgi:two-component system sensor histidine kinase CpxA